MIPYLELLLIMVFVTHLGRRYGSTGIQGFALFFAGLVLVLFAGLRDRSVGTDTDNYVGWFEVITSIESALSFPAEKGFTFLVLMSSILFDNYFGLLSCIAIICVACYFYTIVRLVPRYETALFLFVTLGSYTFFFNGARQGLAAAICFLALPFLLQRKVMIYTLLVLLATLFHKTAVVALPLYYLASVRAGWKQAIVILVSAAVTAGSLTIFAQIAASFVDEKYATYGQAGEGGGEINAAFLLCQGVLFLIFKRQVGDANPYYARLLNIYLIGLIPAIASVIGSVNPSGILRLTSYFSHTAILLWPMIFAGFTTERNRAIASVGFLFLIFAYFILTTEHFSDLTPYRLNSEFFG